ncbi:MAG: DUF2288 domain-containing protein [Spongiibacteraceae bacterium]
MDETDLKTKLNHETAKMRWAELQRFYASGSVIGVAIGVDLIEVAIEFTEDNQAAVAQRLAAGTVFKIDDERGMAWHEQQPELWAVVIAPWILVQEVKA